MTMIQETWSLDRLKNAIRIHATRMVIYGALARQDTSGLAEEMDRIRQAERLVPGPDPTRR